MVIDGAAADWAIGYLHPTDLSVCVCVCVCVEYRAHIHLDYNIY